jgi:hypothetical protein
MDTVFSNLKHYEKNWEIKMLKSLREAHFSEGKDLCKFYKEIENKLQNSYPQKRQKRQKGQKEHQIEITLRDMSLVTFVGFVRRPYHQTTFTVTQIEIDPPPAAGKQPAYTMKYGKNKNRTREYLIVKNKVDENKTDMVNRILDELEYNGYTRGARSLTGKGKNASEVNIDQEHRVIYQLLDERDASSGKPIIWVHSVWDHLKSTKYK